MSEPDLFVVCKNCISEVSPYVTECPYCGQRVRKRAPKIERGEDPDAPPRRKQRRRPTLPRLRPDEIEGIAPDVRPYGAGLLIALSLAATLVIAGGYDLVDKASVVPGFADEPWRWVAAPFLHSNLGYQFIVLAATGIFGMLLERRFGPFAVVGIFLLAGFAGCAAAVGADLKPPLAGDGAYRVDGANAAALGLLCAWLVDSRRRRDEDDDMIGVYVTAAVLALLPVAVEEASLVGGVAGAATGGVLGLLLPVFARR